MTPNTAQEILAQSRSAGRNSLTEWAAKRVLHSFGFNVPKSVVLQAGDDVATAVKDLRPPFALKVMSAGILHKSDVGGVRLGLSNALEVENAIDAMLAMPGISGHLVDGFLLEEMAAKGHELMLGAMVHEHFGPILMLGLGGIFVEALQDVTFRLCPLTRQDAEDMLQEIRGAAVLAGTRGGVVANKEKIVDAIMGVGGEGGLMCVLGGEIAELDVNPLIVNATEAVAVDARILLSGRPA